MADLIDVVRKSTGGGAPGPKGDTGSPGAPGPGVFLIAEDGEEGPLGPPGIAGAQGTAGNTGAQGPAGPAVFLEAESIEGEPGPQGPVGATGATGSTGSQGPLGPAVFLEAAEGEEGLMGPQGVQGLQGATGSSGGTGAQGPLGPAVFLVGEDGEEGGPGPQGIVGPTGATGSPGAQGAPGVAVFLVGEDGEPGEMGPPGAGVPSSTVTASNPADAGVVGVLASFAREDHSHIREQLPGDLYDPTADQTLVAGATTLLSTDPLILDSGRLLTAPATSLLWLDTITPPSQFAQQDYRPNWAETLLTGYETIAQTDPLILDDGVLLSVPADALVWTDTPRSTGSRIASVVNVRDRGAKGDALADANVSITSGAATLTSPSNPWTSADVGKAIGVGRAGAAAITLVTTISAFNHPGSVTLATNAGATVAGEYAVWGTDDTTIVQNVINGMTGGGDVLFPGGNYLISATLTVPNAGIRLMGMGFNQRWRALVRPTQISYIGTTAAISLVPVATLLIDAFQMDHLHLDGQATAATTDGVVVDASAGSNAAVEAFSARDCSFTNFGRYQFSGINQVFDLSFLRCTFHNSGRILADNLVNIDQGAGSVSQITFDDCFMTPYTAGKWAVKVIGQDVRIIGGTYAPYSGGAGANGVWATGGLSVLGGHFEGDLSTTTANIGIRYEGTNGAYISPSFCAIFGIGVQIGQVASATSCIGWTIAGNVGNNNVAAGGFDIQITNGGQRRGMILQTGFPNGNPTISNLRLSNDGTNEVMMFHNWGIQLPNGIAGNAPMTYAAGTNLSTPAIGTKEFDGTAFYNTNDVTNGRRYDDAWNYFRLTGSGTGITTIADFFGTNDGIPLVASGVYEIEWHCYFSQATAGTATWTIVTATTALANLTGEYIGSPVGGIGAVGTPQTAAINVTSSSSTAFPVTGTEATAVTHYFTVRVLATAGAGASNTRLRLTMSAGTATPLINSYFKVRRLAGANVGTYVA